MADEKRIVVETINLTKIYGDGDGVRALDGVSFTIHAGEFVAVMGPSGSGKSTLLNILGALDRPTSGVCKVNDQDLAKVKDIDRFRSRTVGFVFQLHNLIPTLTALENVALALELAGLPDGGRARDALRAVGLDGKERRRPHELSGGEQQRVAVARALVKGPAVILADEPTGNLDTATGDQVLELLSRRCREAGAALLMATHAPLAAQRADRVLRMADGALAPADTAP